MATQLEGLSKKVFDDRYAQRGSDGKQVEQSPEAMWGRVAKAIASVESTAQKREHWTGEFEKVLADFKFVPGGRILSGAGIGVPVTFYNCFVIPSPDDSRGGILDSVKLMVEIMSRSGGVGVNLSSLRPRGALVKGVNGTASGAVSFGGLYSYATGLVIQGGSRRGALMLMLNDDHPDIEEFITVKRTMGLVTNANLSVCISDRFMDAVKDDADWDLQWGGRIFRTMKARDLWNLICESAHACGEPGCFFIERYNKRSNSWYFEKIISTNPCGEQGLGAWSVCNLGSMNVAAFAVDKGIDAPAEFDWDRFRWSVRTATRFLDNVIDATYYPYEENRTAQMGIRRTGLGFMGLGDLLIRMHVRYGSPEGIELTKQLYRTLRDEAYRASVDIAAEKGAFPKYDAEKYLEGWFIKRLPEDIQAGIREHGIRNCFLLTQAPTGTTSLLAGVTSGIEPVYDFVFTRKDRIGEHEVYHARYKEWADAHPGQQHPDYFVNAKQLSPDEHVRMQAAAQEFNDSSISKTVNAPEHHTVGEVQTLYRTAYELGCKGVTYFRDGSRTEAVLSSKPKAESAKAQAEVAEAPRPMTMLEPRPRPEVMQGKTYKLQTAYGTLYVTINSDEAGQPFEVFATIGKSGGFFAAKSEGICRMVSLALRSGIPAQTVIEQLKGIRGPMPSWSKTGMVLSIPDAIAQILDQHVRAPQEKLALAFDDADVVQTPKDTKEDQNKLVLEAMTSTVSVGKSNAAESAERELRGGMGSIANVGWAPECPQCASMLQFQEGCMSCRGCGYSKCT